MENFAEITLNNCYIKTPEDGEILEAEYTVVDSTEADDDAGSGRPELKN